MLGALGGFALPKLFGWLAREAGYPQAAFLAVLALATLSLAWLHVVVLSLRAVEAVRTASDWKTVPQIEPDVAAIEASRS